MLEYLSNTNMKITTIKVLQNHMERIYRTTHNNIRLSQKNFRRLYQLTTKNGTGGLMNPYMELEKYPGLLRDIRKRLVDRNT